MRSFALPWSVFVALLVALPGAASAQTAPRVDPPAGPVVWMPAGDAPARPSALASQIRDVARRIERATDALASSGCKARCRRKQIRALRTARDRLERLTQQLQYRWRVLVPARVAVQGGRTTVWVEAPAQPAQTAPAQGTPGEATPPPAQSAEASPPEPAGPVAMDDGAFRALAAQLTAADMDSDRLVIVQSVAPSVGWTTDQGLALLERFDFPSTRLKAARVVLAHLVDLDDAHRLHEAFEFASDREALKALIEEQRNRIRR